MQMGISMLDRALDLAHQEMAALENGDYDIAVELAEQRNDVTSRAWLMLESGSSEDYRNRLLKLSDLQHQLTDMATQTQERLRQTLNQGKQQKRRLSAYHSALGHALQ